MSKLSKTHVCCVCRMRRMSREKILLFSVKTMPMRICTKIYCVPGFVKALENWLFANSNNGWTENKLTGLIFWMVQRLEHSACKERQLHYRWR